MSEAKKPNILVAPEREQTEDKSDSKKSKKLKSVKIAGFTAFKIHASKAIP